MRKCVFAQPMEDQDDSDHKNGTGNEKWKMVLQNTRNLALDELIGCTLGM